jgi:hypothetical protein
MKAIILIFVIFMCSCNNSVNKNRPENIPENAIWKGGSDGGCWLAIEVTNESILQAIIYYENGELWTKGEFIKKGNCDITKNDIINEIVGYDGESLLTSKSCSFVLNE